MNQSELSTQLQITHEETLSSNLGNLLKKNPPFIDGMKVNVEARQVR